ncbi:murein transglycosylase A [Marinomonas sp. 15G1-11]|uniref:peptidoglycan lytic exotransglycosylase n=1 Tax=Marinomonas phaeophyticola TaxID=3004091 RepID=A0ABT4JSU1_9GAMM|nr:murein transglycosylase A [Marinomonas sp. 15G1-11]MCZ2721290.1 murein transglycosylase A [Marinomonas sp. 15G1-11]
MLTLIVLSACTKLEIDDSNHFDNNGRDLTAQKREQLYLEEQLPPGLPYPAPEFQQGLQQQIHYLNKIKEQDYQLENLHFSKASLVAVTNEISQWLQDPRYTPQLTAHQIAGQDQRGNVQITGYYVPILSVRHTPDDEYRFPLYKKPRSPIWPQDKPLPSREEIDFEGALDGMGLELAYTNSLIDNFFLHVQGSGVVEYEDGQKRLLSWGGVNGHSYRSLGKELIERDEIEKSKMSAQAIRQWLADHPERQREIMSTNPSYLFFSEGPTSPVGAANLPLTPRYSIAVDPNVIPLGSILLGKLPKLDDQGNLIGHAFHLLLAQDKGGAIKGPGHIDWYQGIGAEAKVLAGQLKHFGSVWLLLPSQNTVLQSL